MNLSVLGIVGSPRKNGLTAQTVQKALEGVAEAGVKTEILYLADLHIQPCRDCHPTLACREGEQRCYHRDYFPVISRRIDEADGLVLGSPVYYGDVTRSVDNLINKKVRLRRERPKEGIPGIGIAVAGGGGGGFASALRQIYHFYRIIGVRGLNPIPVTRFNFSSALIEVSEAGRNMASLITKGEYMTGFQRTAAYLDLPILWLDYLQERLHLVNQITEGVRKEESKKSLEAAETMYRKAQKLRASGDKAGAFEATEEAYKLGTAAWNPERR